MHKNVTSAVLVVLILAAIGIPHNLPPDLKAPYELKLLDWLTNLWISWGVAVLILIVGCCLGPKLDYDEKASLGEIIHWKHFPRNWREMLFVLVFYLSVALMFILTVAYISAYGEPGP